MSTALEGLGNHLIMSQSLSFLPKPSTKSPHRISYPDLTGQMTDRDRVLAFIITNVRAILTILQVNVIMSENQATGYAPSKHHNLLVLHMLNVQNDFGREKE
jgi:hypothetical protein